MLTFQSRFGRAKWLEPETDETVKALAKRGVKNARGDHARLLRRLPRDAGGDRGRERAHLQAAWRREFRRDPVPQRQRAGMLVIAQIALRELKGWVYALHAARRMDRGIELRLIVVGQRVSA